MSGAVAVTIGIDIGTTSAKAVAADADGNIVARSRRPHELRVPAPGLLEHDAADAWHRGARQVWAEVREAGNPAAVCVAAMVPSLAPVDAAGAPVGPGLLYGDARGEARPGLPPIENEEFVGFVRFLARHQPDAAGFWPAQTVANRALGGPAVLDTATAMTALPLFTGTGWDPDLCAQLGVLPEQLPSLVGGWSHAGHVDGVPLGAGIPDGLAELVVAGAAEPGDVIVTLGGTLVCWVVTDTWQETDGLWSIPHVAPDRFLLGGPAVAGGLFWDRVRALLGDPPPAEEFAAMLAEIDPAGLPVWVPSLQPERTPVAGSARSGSLRGLEATHTRAHIWRAALEATGFTVRRHIEAAGVPARRIVATGGGTAVGPWMQAIADCCGLAVDVAATTEGAALGAAFAARLVAGLESDLADGARWATTARTVDPDDRWSAPTADRYHRFTTLGDPQ